MYIMYSLMRRGGFSVENFILFASYIIYYTSQVGNNT